MYTLELVYRTIKVVVFKKMHTTNCSACTSKSSTSKCVETILHT